MSQAINLEPIVLMVFFSKKKNMPRVKIEILVKYQIQKLGRIFFLKKMTIEKTTYKMAKIIKKNTKPIIIFSFIYW